MPLQHVSKVYPGMILETDVMAANGRFLCSRGQSLNRENIKALMTWGVEQVYVMNGPPSKHSPKLIQDRAELSFKVTHINSLPAHVPAREAQQSALTSLYRKLPAKPEDNDPEKWIFYYRKLYELSLSAVEQAAELCNLPATINRKDNPEKIMAKANQRLQRLIQFRTYAFFVMNENSSAFELVLSNPQEKGQVFDGLLMELVKCGEIASMIRNRHPAIQLDHSRRKCLVHLISTTSRVRGLFIGYLQDGDPDLPLEIRSLLANVLQYTASALESSQLYSLITRNNIELQNTVEKRTAELRQTIQNLEQEVQQRKTAQRNLDFILNNVHDSIFIFTPQGKIDEVNAKMLSMFGVSREEALQMNIPADISCKSFYRNKNMGNWHEVIEKGSGIFEWTAQRQDDGSTFPVEVYLKKITWNGRGAVLATLRNISQRKEAEKKLEFMALHDPLTELPNRKLFLERLGQSIIRARRNALQAAVLFIDLDGFKPVNDTFGHYVGDKVLKTIAERLCSSLRESDTVARLGGDEFGIIIPDLYADKDCTQIVDKAQHTLSQPIKIDGHCIHLGCSIGTAMFPRNGENVDTLIKVADTEMYKAKRQKKVSLVPHKEPVLSHSLILSKNMPTRM